MKFAFILMGNFDSKKDRSVFAGSETHTIGVSSVAEACEVAKELATQGFGCIELCGAFCEEGARAVIEATDHKIPVGFVVHLPEQDELFRKAFPND